MLSQYVCSVETVNSAPRVHKVQTRQKWWDAIHRGSCWLQRNWHLYDTEAFQATRNITSGGPHHRPRQECMSDATCNAQPENVDHSAVLGWSRTGRQISCAHHANASVQSSTWLTMVPQTKSCHPMSSIDSIQWLNASGAGKMTLMTMAVGSRVSEVENDIVMTNILVRYRYIDTWSNRIHWSSRSQESCHSICPIPCAMHRAAGSNFGTHHIGLSSWGYRPKRWIQWVGGSGSSCCRRATRGETWMTATGLRIPEGSDRMAELGAFVGKPLMTRSPGYFLPPLPSFVLILWLT